MLRKAKAVALISMNIRAFLTGILLAFLRKAEGHESFQELQRVYPQRVMNVLIGG